MPQGGILCESISIMYHFCDTFRGDGSEECHYIKRNHLAWGWHREIDKFSSEIDTTMYVMFSLPNQWAQDLGQIFGCRIGQAAYGREMGRKGTLTLCIFGSS